MKPLKAMDSHCHADILLERAPNFPRLYKDRKIGGITWSYNERISSYKEYPSYWNRQRQLVQTLRQQGIPFFYLVGIHPRCIPKDLAQCREMPKLLKDALKEHMENPLCLGIGEIGLDESNAEEEKIFRWQLEIAEKITIPKKRIGIHTPRNKKKEVTEKILRHLEYFEPLHPFILIDHVLPETFEMVFERGYSIGITLQEGKASVEDVANLVERYPNRMSAVMLNSDSAKGISEPYLEFLEKGILEDQELRKAMLVGNCVNFFNLDEGRLKP